MNKVVRIRFFCLLSIFFLIINSYAQSIEINGTVIVDDDEIEGIHIINKTANRFTITNSLGNFSIPAKLNDTIIFSAIKYKPKEIIITSNILISKTVNVYLTELVNQLDQVIVGRILTGNLLSDIENSDAKREINFYNLGISGYTGKPLTQSERRLNEATTGGGIVPLNPIINAITGRTKMLKNQIKLERLDDCMSSIKSNLSNFFFESNHLDTNLRAEFFYFCSEDPEFSSICKLKNDIYTLEFLKSKLERFKGNLQNKKE